MMVLFVAEISKRGPSLYLPDTEPWRCRMNTDKSVRPAADPPEVPQPGARVSTHVRTHSLRPLVIREGGSLCDRSGHVQAYRGKAGDVLSTTPAPRQQGRLEQRVRIGKADCD